MFLFVGVGTSMAQDKAAAKEESATKTEVTAKKDHECPPDCAKKCCAKDAKASAKKECSHAHGAKKECSHASATSSDKKACSPDCKKSCCMADAKAKKKDEHEGHDH